MIQAVAVLITAGLIVGGLVGTDVIGDDDAARSVASQTTAAGAAAPVGSDPSDEPAPSDQKSAGGSGAGDGQGGAAPSGGQEKPDGAAPAAGGSQRDVARFCTTTQRLQRASRQFFAQVESQGAAPGPPEPAQDRFLKQSQELIGAAQQLAPARVRSDLDLLINALRAGPDQAPDRSQVEAAQRSIAQFERKSC